MALKGQELRRYLLMLIANTPVDRLVATVAQNTRGHSPRWKLASGADSVLAIFRMLDEAGIAAYREAMSAPRYSGAEHATKGHHCQGTLVSKAHHALHTRENPSEQRAYLLLMLTWATPSERKGGWEAFIGSSPAVVQVEAPTRSEAPVTPEGATGVPPAPRPSSPASMEGLSEFQQDLQTEVGARDAQRWERLAAQLKAAGVTPSWIADGTGVLIRSNNGEAVAAIASTERGERFARNVLAVTLTLYPDGGEPRLVNLPKVAAAPLLGLL